MRAYVADALKGQRDGHMLPWCVRDLAGGALIGSTRYHDIVRDIDRVEIGYTWYGAKWQRSHVNTTCKLLLLTHAFETLGCKVVGLRTDNFNFASQKAIEALGAKKDGVIRHHWPRKDGSVRDSVIYSILVAEWPDVKRHLGLRLARGSRSPSR
jgi:RimJ/RimL family protein N-acetyltransferase